VQSKIPANTNARDFFFIIFSFFLCDVASWASKMTSFVITPLALDFYSENQIITP
jgi:hypothetical protein